MQRLDEAQDDEEHPCHYALVRAVLDWYRTGIRQPIPLSEDAKLMPASAGIDAAVDADDLADALACSLPAGPDGWENSAVPSDAAMSGTPAEGGTSWGRAYALPVVLAVIGALGASGAVNLAGVNVPWVVILLVFLAVGTIFFLGARFVLREIAERREAAYRQLAGLDRRLRVSEERYLSNAEIDEVNGRSRRSSPTANPPSRCRPLRRRSRRRSPTSPEISCCGLAANGSPHGSRSCSR